MSFDKQGLNANELKTFSDLLVMANDIQIKYMWLEFQEHVLQRVKRQHQEYLIKRNELIER